MGVTIVNHRRIVELSCMRKFLGLGVIVALGVGLAAVEPPSPREFLSGDAQVKVGPQPPCGAEPVPPYPSLGDTAAVRLWDSDDASTWKPPACTGWQETGFNSLVSITARFAHTSGAPSLMRQMGAISALKGLSYWSRTRQQWQTLILQAYALRDADSDQPRADFSPDEFKQGKLLYFAEEDNVSGKATYRMQILNATADHLVVEVENVSTIRYHLLPVIRPGELQSIYFLDRESDRVWRYYSIVRTGKHVNHLLVGDGSSLINRAVAFYRYYVGIPGKQEPPAAR